MMDVPNMAEMIVDICTTHDRASAEQHVREAVEAVAQAAREKEREHRRDWLSPGMVAEAIHHHHDELVRRNGVWGTCAGCPRASDGTPFPELCGNFERYDHKLKPLWSVAAIRSCATKGADR